MCRPLRYDRLCDGADLSDLGLDCNRSRRDTCKINEETPLYQYISLFRCFCFRKGNCAADLRLVHVLVKLPRGACKMSQLPSAGVGVGSPTQTN